MGNSKNLITYLLLVLARAGSKTKNYLDVKNVIIGFVVSGFGSLAYQYLYQDKQYEWKALLASAVIIFIILAMITFLSFFIQEPAAVYYEQHTKIAKQESIINPEISLDLLP